MCVQRKSFRPFHFVPCVLVLMLFVSTGFSQLMWQRYYGGPGLEEGYWVEQTTDGGYIVVGMSASFGNGYQVYLIKTDSLGDTLWTKTYGGSGDEYGYSVQPTADNGYIITGSTGSFGNGDQVHIIKTDSVGDTLWTKNYGGPNRDVGWSVQQTTDNGYIIIGFTSSFGHSHQIYAIKTDTLGDTLWAKTCGGSGRDRGYSVQQTTDGGYIIAGCANVPLDYDPVYLIKTDSFGDTLWSKTYGTDWYFGRSVQQTNDGGYIVAGYDYIEGHVYLVKTNSFGDTIWTRDHYWSEGAVTGYCVKQTTDRGYIVSCHGLGAYETHYMVLIKTDSLGYVLWTKSYGTGMCLFGAQCVQQTTDGGYILVGTNGDQIWLIKTDAEGNAGIEGSNFVPHSPSILQLVVSPNPFVSFTTVVGYEKERFILYDVSGKRVGIYPGNSIGFGLPAGVYFIIPEDKSFRPVRVVKVK